MAERGAMTNNAKIAKLVRDPLQTAGPWQAITAPISPDTPIPFDVTSDRQLQRAHGLARLALGGSDRGTRIIETFEKCPVRIMFPKLPGAAVNEAVLINTGGGITGGDRLDYSVIVNESASIAVTSQAAEKVYRALDEPARITTKLTMAGPAKLAWLPQETILFNGARIRRTTEIELHPEAELLALEWIVLGRAAHGEQMMNGQIIDSWRVKKDGQLIWADIFRSVDEIFPLLHKRALLSDCKALGTLVYYGRDLDRRLEMVRDIIPALDCRCGATVVSRLLIVRLAAEVAFVLKLALQRVLQRFRLDVGPGPFGVPKMWSC